MRILLVLWFIGLMVAPARADNPKLIFALNILNAYVAKVTCPGVRVEYEDLVERAVHNNMPLTIISQMKEGIAYFYSRGQRGQQQDRDLMLTISSAARMVELDMKYLGKERWCDHQRTRLTGYIRTD